MAPSRTRDRHGTSSLVPSCPSPSAPRPASAYPQGIAKVTQQRSAQPRVEAWIDELQRKVDAGATVKVSGQALAQIPGFRVRSPSVLQPATRFEKPIHDSGRQYRPPKHIRRGSDGPYDHFRPLDPSEALPFDFTYDLLSFVQKLLEQTLFYWSMVWLPMLLEQQGWETPAQGELNGWEPALRRHFAPTHAFSRSVGMNQRVLESLLHNNLRYIRHAAVHRKPTPIATLKRMLADAQRLTSGLREASRGEKLKAIAMALESGDVEKMRELMVAPVATSGDGQRMTTPKPPPVTIDLTGDDDGDVAPGTNKPAERHVIDLTED